MPCSQSLFILFLYFPSFRMSVGSGASQFLLLLSISAVMLSVPTAFHRLRWSITFLTSPSHILPLSASWRSFPVLDAKCVFNRDLFLLLLLILGWYVLVRFLAFPKVHLWLFPVLRLFPSGQSLLGCIQCIFEVWCVCVCVEVYSSIIAAEPFCFPDGMFLFI